MKYLQLSNRIVNDKCENLCYINASLNLLNVSEEFSQFFQQLNINSNDLLQKFPVSAELSKIFTGAVKSAAVLRSTIAEKSKKPQFLTWNQQDITEFHRVLLDVLEKEFKSNNCEEGQALLDKFIGREKQSLEFVTECSVCQYKPDDQIDKFDILSLDISANVTSRKLSDVVQEHYSQTDDREVRCQCPDSANKAVRVTTSLSQAPDYLFIELRRYRIVAGNQYKSIQIVRLDDVLTLPTGEEYHLVGVTDHRGETIQSGHYVTFVRSDSDWFLVNDNRVSKVNRDYVTSQDNVLLYYTKQENIHKQNEICDEISDNLRNVNIEEPSTAETHTVTDKVPCLNCGKKYKHIFPHIKGNDSCQEKYNIEEEKQKYNLIRAEISRKSRARTKQRDPEAYAEKEKENKCIKE